MQWPPDSRKARAGIPGLENASAFYKSQNLDSEQGILTVIPVGEGWCIKALYAKGEVIRFGSFDSRLEALGAAVLLAEHLGARVVP